MSIFYNNNLDQEDSDISRAFSEAEFCFQEALKCARYEEWLVVTKMVFNYLISNLDWKRQSMDLRKRQPAKFRSL